VKRVVVGCALVALLAGIDGAIAALPTAIGAAEAVGRAVVDAVVALLTISDETIATTRSERAVGLTLVVANPIVDAVVADLSVADHAVAAVGSPNAPRTALLGLVVGGNVEPVVAHLGAVDDGVTTARREGTVRIAGAIGAGVVGHPQVARLVANDYPVTAVRRAQALRSVEPAQGKAIVGPRNMSLGLENRNLVD